MPYHSLPVRVCVSVLVCILLLTPPYLSKSLYLLDGDKQSVLIATYLKEQLESIPQWKFSDIKLGVVQTAYANFNCTRTLTDHIGVPVVCVPTGVKYLHHTGKELDIRIYFEVFPACLPSL